MNIKQQSNFMIKYSFNKKHFIEKSDNKNNTIWTIVNSLIKKNNDNHLLQSNNVKNLANEFNEYFLNAAPNLTTNINRSEPQSSNTFSVQLMT